MNNKRREDILKFCNEIEEIYRRIEKLDYAYDAQLRQTNVSPDRLRAIRDEISTLRERAENISIAMLMR